eukprot:COSAG06_NODE_6250_length_3013_cov_8.100892_1_plen_93_part_00
MVDDDEQVVELEEACRWWAEAADGGVGLAALRLGRVSEERGEYSTAVEWYMTASDAKPPMPGLAEALVRAHFGWSSGVVRAQFGERGQEQIE